VLDVHVQVGMTDAVRSDDEFPSYLLEFSFFFVLALLRLVSKLLEQLKRFVICIVFRWITSSTLDFLLKLI